MIFLLPYRYYYEQELKKCFKFFYVAEKVISPQTVFIKSIPIYNCAVRRAAVRSTYASLQEQNHMKCIEIENHVIVIYAPHG